MLFFFLFPFNYTRVPRAKRHKSASGSRFYTVQCSFQATALYTINKVTEKSPTEICFCQVTCPTPHPSTATTHSKSVWTASLFFSVLVVPCYFGCFNPAMAARSAKQQCQCLSLLVSCASTLTEMTTSHNIPPVCLHKTRWSHVHKFRQLTQQSTTLFSLIIPSKLSSTGLHYHLMTVLQLNFTVWQNQVVRVLYAT